MSLLKKKQMDFYLLFSKPEVKVTPDKLKFKLDN